MDPLETSGSCAGMDPKPTPIPEPKKCIDWPKIFDKILSPVTWYMDTIANISDSLTANDVGRGILCAAMFVGTFVAVIACWGTFNTAFLHSDAQLIAFAHAPPNRANLSPEKVASWKMDTSVLTWAGVYDTERGNFCPWAAQCRGGDNFCFGMAYVSAGFTQNCEQRRAFYNKNADGYEILLANGS